MLSNYTVKTEQTKKVVNKATRFAIQEIHSYIKDMETIDEDIINRLCMIFEVNRDFVEKVHKKESKIVRGVLGLDK